MRRVTGYAAVLLALLTLMGSCDPGAPEARPAPTRVPDLGPDGPAVVKSSNTLALELYARLSGQGGNIFLSPYSISSALAMTFAGARGETATQMAKAMHFDLPPDRLHAAFSGLGAVLDAAGTQAGCELVVANALWAQKGASLLDGFLDLVQKRYGAKAAELDFQGAAAAARGTINRWVDKQTRGKITDLVAEGSLDPLTRLVLANAIYFRGTWASEFPASATEDAPFTLPGGQRVQVPMMHQSGHFGYTEADGVQVLELTYKGEAVSMAVVLPSKIDGLPEVEKSLTAEKLAGWFSALSRRGPKVRVFVPRFRLATTVNLNQSLRSLGMADAFVSGEADFSGMNGKTDLFLSAVLHKACVDVNEKGTEAAAATAVVVKSETKAPDRPLEFRADHPFLFLIRHTPSGSILFLGRVVNPKD